MNIKKRLNADLTPYFFILPAIIVFCLFIVYPLLYSVNLSLHEWNGFTPTWDRFVGLNNYRDMFGDYLFWIAFTNNFKVMLVRLPLEIIIALLLAIILDREIKGKNLWQTILFLPVIMPLIVVALVWQRIYEPNIGLLNTLLRSLGLNGLAKVWLGDPKLAIYATAIVSTWKNIGFSMVIFLAALQGIPEELKEAAIVDGATEAQIVWRVTLPLLKPTIRIAIVLSMISIFKIFDLTYILTGGGPSHRSEVLASYMYFQAFSMGKMGLASAAVVVLLALVLSISLVQSYILKSQELQY